MYKKHSTPESRFFDKVEGEAVTNVARISQSQKGEEVTMKNKEFRAV